MIYIVIIQKRKFTGTFAAGKHKYAAKTRMIKKQISLSLINGAIESSPVNLWQKQIAKKGFSTIFCPERLPH